MAKFRVLCGGYQDEKGVNHARGTDFESHYRLDLTFANAFLLLELAENEIEAPNGDVGTPPKFMDE